MVICDLIRMALMLLVAMPGNCRSWAILALLFATTLANPPSQAARSALMPLILTGDRLVVGLSINASAGQAAQVVGYLVGAAIAAVNPTRRAADQRGHLRRARRCWSGSACGTGRRAMTAGAPQPPAAGDRRRASGSSSARPVLRAIARAGVQRDALLDRPGGPRRRLGGRARPTAASTRASRRRSSWPPTRSASSSAGCWSVGRLSRRPRRLTLMRPLAVLAPLALVPALLDPPPVVVALLAAVCGFAVAGLLPVANGLFVQALPDGYRARAFGVMATGMQVIQGVAVLATGAARRAVLHPVGGRACGARAGVLLMLAAALAWPGRRRRVRRRRRGRPADRAAAPTVTCRRHAAPGDGARRPAPADDRAPGERRRPQARGRPDRHAVPGRTAPVGRPAARTWQDGTVTSAGESDRPGASMTLFEAVGGEPTFRKLVDEFYAGVATDPLLRPMYPEEDLGPAADRLALFLDAVLGRPEHLLGAARAPAAADAARAVPDRRGGAGRLAAPHAAAPWTGWT